MNRCEAYHVNSCCFLVPSVLTKMEVCVLSEPTEECELGLALAHCKALKALSLSNQFETSDYACLSVALPGVACSMLAPWLRIRGVNGLDTMITGRKKPILDSRKDAAAITAFEVTFRRRQDGFRQ